MGPEDLETVLRSLPHLPDDRLLVGLESRDDAAVYRLGGEQVVAATVDFFTPLVDDPEDFGAIAAANAFSDLYAMGVEPAFALSILAIPAGEFSESVIGAIFRGASDVCREAGVSIAGGHSVDDPEPKFGLVAVGLGERGGVFRKSGGVAGDELVLGKAIGTGVVTTGIKQGSARESWIRAATESMRQLNRRAVEVARGFEPHAVTDVTGFGLLGHLSEICRASGVDARIDAGAPVLLPGALELAAAGCVPGGTGRNREATGPRVRWEGDVDDALRILLFDAQTSGGLLTSVPSGRGEGLARAWSDAGYAAAMVGELTPREGDSFAIGVTSS